MPRAPGRAAVLASFFMLGSSISVPVFAQPAAKPAAEVFVPCTFHGRAALAMDTQLRDERGRAIARFGGAEAALTVIGLSTATPSRAYVQTGGFRLRGYVDTRALPIATRETTPVSAGHVWLGAKRRVRVVLVTPERVKLELEMKRPFSQTFVAYAACSKLTLGSVTPTGWSPSGNERGYVLRKPALELYDAPGGTLVSVLQRAADAPAVLFFGSEASAGWLRLEYRGDVVVDAWVRASDVEALPRGETLDQLAAPQSARSAPRLAVPGSPRSVRPARDVPIYAKARDAEASIGVIEAGTETLVLDVVAGWVSVVPKALDVMPAPNGAFWVKREALGI